MPKVLKRKHKPVVSGSDESQNEMSFKAIFLGLILGLIFCVGNTYLGLKVGMTVSASIPSAVMAVGIFRLLRLKGTILENNIVQTVAAVGEGLAAGVIFTVPALFLLGQSISNSKIFILSFFGGILGILFMIPMRRYIIVKEHNVLPFPEGTACAQILMAGEKEAKYALTALWGIIIGVVYKLFTNAFHFIKDQIAFTLPQFQNTQIRFSNSPALLGVGYIIGPRIAALMLAGGAFGWWILIPLTRMFAGSDTIIYPATLPVLQMSAEQMWSNYLRYIGAGSVAIGGLYNLAKIFPMIIKTFHIGFKELFSGFKREGKHTRVDRDVSMGFLIIGSVAIVLLLWLLPHIQMNLVTVILLVVLGYFFVAVTSITVGLVGSSSNPVSGMVITIVLITSLLFLAFGWVEKVYLITAITMGAVASVAICLASTTSQDLKTGFLVGATPRSQQIAEIIGLILPCACIGLVLTILNQTYTFGSLDLPAPQAMLISIITKGVITGQLPITLMVIGLILGGALIIMGIQVLPFAIGLYLPLEISTTIMLGGIVRYLLDHYNKSRSESNENGILASSGIVAGDACCGVVIAILTATGFINKNAISYFQSPASLICLVVLASAILLLAMQRQKKT